MLNPLFWNELYEILMLFLFSLCLSGFFLHRPSKPQRWVYMFLHLWIMNTVSSFVYELLLLSLPAWDSCWNKCIYTLTNHIIAFFICFYLVVRGRARNKTAHFRNMLFISRKQMFILPALCEESWINMVFVSEVNKTTMQQHDWRVALRCALVLCGFLVIEVEESVHAPQYSLVFIPFTAPRCRQKSALNTVFKWRNEVRNSRCREGGEAKQKHSGHEYGMCIPCHLNIHDMTISMS